MRSNVLTFFLNCRGDGSSGGAVVGERLLSTLLTEMDGLEEAKVSFYFFLYWGTFYSPTLASSFIKRLVETTSSLFLSIN